MHGTKKDYSKIANGVDDTLADADDDNACVGTRRSKQKQTEDGDRNGGGVLNRARNSDTNEIEENVSEEEEIEDNEDSDEELKIAEAKLELMKKEQKILQKQAKRARILRETAELEKSLQSLRKSNSKSKKTVVTAATLRSMDDVVDEVDRLMDKNMNIKSVDDSSSSEAESDVVSSSSTSGLKSRKQVKEVKGRKADVKTSGKSKNFLNSDCQFPQKWPHNFLNPHFVSSKEKSFEDLTMSEFCAGFLTILERESEEKRMYRIAHLKELMYLSSRFKWRNILDYHGACLLEIERGQLKWGDSFQILQSTTLAG